MCLNARVRGQGRGKSKCDMVCVCVCVRALNSNMSSDEHCNLCCVIQVYSMDENVRDYVKQATVLV